MTVSFFHEGDHRMASYRYRTLIPAKQIGATINDPQAQVWVFSKPCRDDLDRLRHGKLIGKTCIVDICDPHYPHAQHYDAMIREAHAVVAPTAWMADLLMEDFHRPITVITDPYELPTQMPHVNGTRLLWFGHPSNLESLRRVEPLLKDYAVRVMTDPAHYAGALPWSLDGLWEELTFADIVILPETAPYKSPNRAVEAVRAGCFVVAEPHPSLRGWPGIWIGNMKEGIAWANENRVAARQRVIQSQAYVLEQHSPERVGNAWKTLTMGYGSISAAGTNPGMAGSTSIKDGPHSMPMSSPM